MITCCEIALVLGVTNVISLAIFAGYTIKLRTRQMILERKNGKEEALILTQQAQLDELKTKLEKLEKSHAKN